MSPRHRASRGALVAIGLLAMAGCIMEADTGEPLDITNMTDREVLIMQGDATLRTLPPGESRRVGLPEDCMDWRFRAVVDELVVARLGPPVCGGEWLITPEMVERVFGAPG